VDSGPVASGIKVANGSPLEEANVKREPKWSNRTRQKKGSAGHWGVNEEAKNGELGWRQKGPRRTKKTRRSKNDKKRHSTPETKKMKQKNKKPRQIKKPTKERPPKRIKIQEKKMQAVYIKSCAYRRFMMRRRSNKNEGTKTVDRKGGRAKVCEINA